MSKIFEQGWPNDVLAYFKDIVKYELLTPEREIELAIKVKNGDNDAFNELVTSNLRFVVTIAKEYQNQGLSLMDLINEGNYGLTKAVTRYDHTKGFRFISYGVWWIKQSIIQSLNDTSRTIRVPTNVIKQFFNDKKTLEEFCNLNYDGQLDVETINKHIDSPILTKCISLNKIINERGDELENLLEYKVTDYNDYNDYYDIDSNVKREMNVLLSKLSIREREIIELYFGIDKEQKLEIIGKKYGLTKERIRQIKESAIRKLRYDNEALFKVLNH